MQEMKSTWDDNFTNPFQFRDKIVTEGHHCARTSALANIIPEKICSFSVVATKNFAHKARVFQKIPVAELIELTAGSDKWSPPKCPPRAPRLATMGFQALGKIDIFDGHVARIKSTNCLEVLFEKPE